MSGHMLCDSIYIFWTRWTRGLEDIGRGIEMAVGGSVRRLFDKK